MNFFKSLILTFFIIMTTNSFSCTIPKEIVFERAYSDAPILAYQRETQNDELESLGNAAYVVFDCVGVGTQWLSFNVSFDNFFSGAGDHFAILTRATVTQNSYIARGPILHKDWGVVGEYYNLNGGPDPQMCQVGPGTANGGTCNGSPDCYRAWPMIMKDSLEPYNVGIHAAPTHIAYTVLHGEESASQMWYEKQNSTVLTGHQLAFAVLINESKNSRFRIRISDISAGWF